MSRKPCIVADCGRPSHAKGLCRRCYQRADYNTPEGRARVRERQRLRYAESPTFATEVKAAVAARYWDLVATPEGRSTENARLRRLYDKQRLDPEKMAVKAAQSAAFRARNPEYVSRMREAQRQPENRRKEKALEKIRLQDPDTAEARRWVARKKRWMKIGFTLDLVLDLLDFQGHSCALCTRVIQMAESHKHDSVQADHCHTTSKPRGLLCRPCNVSLGNYEKHQRLFGLVVPPYEDYITQTPVSLLTTNPVHAILSTQEPANDNEENAPTEDQAFVERSG